MPKAFCRRYTAESPRRFLSINPGPTVMPRQHYSSPVTAERQWRGCDATTNVSDDVDCHLRDDPEFCLDGKGNALRSPYPAGRHSACGNVGLRVRQEVVQHIVLIDIYTKPTIPLVVAYRGRQSWQRLCLKPLEQCSLANIASVNRERN